MASQSTPQPKRGYLRAWAVLLIGLSVGVGVVLWRARNATPVTQTEPLSYTIVMAFIGCVFTALGVASYLLVLFTGAFTFDFTRPVWEGVKVRMFLANVIVLLLAVIGVGVLLGGLLNPWLAGIGGSAMTLPIVISVVTVQFSLVFVLIWSPLEKRIITRRLTALGISREQMTGGLYIGLSSPLITSSRKRFFCIEEDVGMLWFTPAQMIFWGDQERFAISREQLAQIERKTDAKSTTALSGTAHVILHLRLPDGNERQIRLHTEGIWTMIGKRRASDNLAARIGDWYNAPPVAAS
jgi:hypothetical protein